MRTWLVIVGTVWISVCSIAGQSNKAAAAPWIGTWKLNIIKSKFAGPPVKSRTAKIEAVSGGLRIVTDTVDAQDKTQHSDYTLTLDGKDVVIATVAQGPQTYSFKSVDAYTFERIMKINGATAATTHIVVARDGKTMTSTDKRNAIMGSGMPDPDESKATDSGTVLVFDRQP